jgi:hypothetical protein
MLANKICVILFFCLPGAVSSVVAQDKLLFMNGRELSCTVAGDTGAVLKVLIERKSGKQVTREFPKSDLFSYTPAGKGETVLYAKDEAFGNIYSVEEMRVYMAGERDAADNFRALPTFITGVALCGTLAYLGEGGVIATVAPPLVYAGLQFIPKIKIRQKTMSDPGYRFNDVYADGYEPPARSRKVMAGLSGGVTGVVTGALVFTLLK